MTMGIAPPQEQTRFVRLCRTLSSDPTASVPVSLAGKMASTERYMGNVELGRDRGQGRSFKKPR